FEAGRQGSVGHLGLICGPIETCRIEKWLALREQVVRLAQEVRERKADVEGRVSPMKHLVIEQHETVWTYQNVLRAVITVDQRDTCGGGLGDQAGKKIRCRRMTRGGVAIVG